jgi:chromatin remodeling complex protein RSC6
MPKCLPSISKVINEGILEDYIKKHELQNPQNRREILADDKLEAVFGKKKVTMFEMNKYLAQHLTPPEAG